MFYEEEDILVVRFGTGDIAVVPGHETGTKNGTVSLIDHCGKPLAINVQGNLPGDQLDTEMNTMVRLVFEKPESVDALIWALNEAKNITKQKGYAMRNESAKKEFEKIMAWAAKKQDDPASDDFQPVTIPAPRFPITSPDDSGETIETLQDYLELLQVILQDDFSVSGVYPAVGIQLIHDYGSELDKPPAVFITLNIEYIF